MFHRTENIRKIKIKRVFKVFLEKVEWSILLFGNFTEKKLVMSK